MKSSSTTPAGATIDAPITVLEAGITAMSVERRRRIAPSPRTSRRDHSPPSTETTRSARPAATSKRSTWTTGQGAPASGPFGTVCVSRRAAQSIPSGPEARSTMPRVSIPGASTGASEPLAGSSRKRPPSSATQKAPSPVRAMAVIEESARCSPAIAVPAGATDQTSGLLVCLLVITATCTSRALPAAASAGRTTSLLSSAARTSARTPSKKTSFSAACAEKWVPVMVTTVLAPPDAGKSR